MRKIFAVLKVTVSIEGNFLKTSVDISYIIEK
jgi:hypothetical protein